MKKLEVKVVEENKPSAEQVKKIIQKLNEMLNKICSINASK